MAHTTTASISPDLPKRLTLAEGQDLVASWQASGLSAVAFSRQHRVPIHRLSYWRGRISTITPLKSEITAPQRQPARSTFIEMVPELPSIGLDIHLPFGIRLRVDRGFDQDLLRAVVSTLAQPDVG
jgi:hypothetical protein